MRKKRICFIITTVIMTIAMVMGQPHHQLPPQPQKGELVQRVETSNHVYGTVERSSFFENTFIRINGGTNMPLTGGISETTGFAGLELGKNITPVFGVAVEGWMNFSNLYGGTAIDFSNVALNARVNLSNAIGGYVGAPRLVEVQLVPGIGWGHGYTRDPNVAKYDRNFLTYNTFAEVDFNLGKQKQYQINVNPGFVWLAGNNKVNFDVNRCLFQVKVGFTYKFGRKGSHNFRVCNHVITQEEYDRVYEEYLKLYNRPEPQPRVIEKHIPGPTAHGAPHPQMPNLLVNFKIGTSVLTDLEKARIDKYVEHLPKGTIVVVTGGADLKTGSRRRNEALSTNRANAVVEYLKLKDVRVRETRTKFDAFKLAAASRGAIIQVVTE